MTQSTPYEELSLKDLKALPEVRHIPNWYHLPKGEIIAGLKKIARQRALAQKRAKKNEQSEEPLAPKPRKKKAFSSPTVETPAPASKKSPAKKAVATEKKKPLAPPQKKEEAISAPVTPKKKKSPVKTISEVLPAPSVPTKTPRGRKKSVTAASAVSKVKKQVSSNEQAPIKPFPTFAPLSESAPAPSKLSVLADPAFSVTEETEAPTPISEVRKKPEVINSRQTQEDRQRVLLAKQTLAMRKTLETPSIEGKPAGNRIVLTVCGPFWLHAWWEISGTEISRVRAAMRHLWHTADPILRVYKITSDRSGPNHQEHVSDITICGGIYNWYIHVDDPPQTFMVEIGYRARDGQFFSLTASNIVQTPQNSFQENFSTEPQWRSLNASRDPLAGIADSSLSGDEELSSYSSETVDPRALALPIKLSVEAEVVIRGETSPGAKLSICGSPVQISRNGGFFIRYTLPERRHVFPILASTQDGAEAKRIVLAIERNTKTLESIIRDSSEEE